MRQLIAFFAGFQVGSWSQSSQTEIKSKQNLALRTKSRLFPSLFDLILAFWDLGRNSWIHLSCLVNIKNQTRFNPETKAYEVLPNNPLPPRENCQVCHDPLNILCSECEAVWVDHICCPKSEPRYCCSSCHRKKSKKPLHEPVQHQLNVTLSHTKEKEKPQPESGGNLTKRANSQTYTPKKIEFFERMKKLMSTAIKNTINELSPSQEDQAKETSSCKKINSAQKCWYNASVDEQTGELVFRFNFNRDSQNEEKETVMEEEGKEQSSEELRGIIKSTLGKISEYAGNGYFLTLGEIDMKVRKKLRKVKSSSTRMLIYSTLLKEINKMMPEWNKLKKLFGPSFNATRESFVNALPSYEPTRWPSYPKTFREYSEIQNYIGSDLSGERVLRLLNTSKKPRCQKNCKCSSGDIRDIGKFNLETQTWESECCDRLGKVECNDECGCDKSKCQNRTKQEGESATIEAKICWGIDLGQRTFLLDVLLKNPRKYQEDQCNDFISGALFRVCNTMGPNGWNVSLACKKIETREVEHLGVCTESNIYLANRLRKLLKIQDFPLFYLFSKGLGITCNK